MIYNYLTSSASLFTGRHQSESVDDFIGIRSYQLHRLFQQIPRLKFPFSEDKIPSNGIYTRCEIGEVAHGTERIVRIGTHTGNDHDDQLASIFRAARYLQRRDEDKENKRDLPQVNQAELEDIFLPVNRPKDRVGEHPGLEAGHQVWKILAAGPGFG